MGYVSFLEGTVDGNQKSGEKTTWNVENPCK